MICSQLKTNPVKAPISEDCFGTGFFWTGDISEVLSISDLEDIASEMLTTISLKQSNSSFVNSTTIEGTLTVMSFLIFRAVSANREHLAVASSPK